MTPQYATTPTHPAPAPPQHQQGPPSSYYTAPDGQQYALVPVGPPPGPPPASMPGYFMGQAPMAGMTPYYQVQAAQAQSAYSQPQQIGPQSPYSQQVGPQQQAWQPAYDMSIMPAAPSMQPASANWMQQPQQQPQQQQPQQQQRRPTGRGNGRGSQRRGNGRT